MTTGEMGVVVVLKWQKEEGEGVAFINDHSVSPQLLQTSAYCTLLELLQRLSLRRGGMVLAFIWTSWGGNVGRVSRKSGGEGVNLAPAPPCGAMV